MATFTPPTYEQPINNRLGQHGISFPVGKVVWIRASDDEVIETTLIVDPTDIDAAKAGSGDFGKAIFRRGKTYEVTAGEQTLLEGAGYTVV
jgi:hypothetical protein